MRPFAGMTFQFPTVPRQATGDALTYDALKKRRDARLDEVARLLDDARAYARGAGSNRTRDWALEALVPVVNRELPLVTAVRSAPDIREAVAFAERVDVDLVLSGALEAPLVASLLSERDIPVILGPVLTLPTQEDMFHAASYQAGGQLARARVKIAFATGGSTGGYLLSYHAAQSVAWGLEWDEAIKALTINAAEILGVADRIGSIEPGKMANLLVADGDPLEVRTQLLHVFINGRDVGLDNHHRALYDRYRARP